MSRFVLDCSVTMAWCFEDETDRFTEAVLGMLAENGALVPRLWPLEVAGLLIKPFALTVRLAANMTAGHIILAVLMSFLTASVSLVVGLLVYPASFFGLVAITLFEILISLIQAYIFTILSCVFVGAAVSHEH